jgi:hypothetical protein
VSRLRSLLCVLAIGVLSLSACTEVEEESESGYEPAKLADVKGSDDVKRVTLTEEGAARVGLRTARVKSGIVPYAALIYDAEGKTYVYTSPKPLSYLREEVEVDRVDGDHAYLSRGPPSGTEVVTTGAAEVHGAELEIAE